MVKELSNPDPLHARPKAHAEEKETPDDEQRRSKLLGDVAEDNPVLGEPRSRKEKAAPLKDSLPRRPKQKGLTQWASHGSMVEEQF